MLVGTMFTGVVSFFLNSYYTGKHLGYSSLKQLKDVAPSYGTALLVALAVYFFKYLPVSNWIILPIQLIIGAVVLFVVSEKAKLQEYIEVKEIVKDYFMRIKR